MAGNLKVKACPGNLDHAGLIVDVLMDNKVKNNKSEVILKKDDQEVKAYFLYYSVSNL
jgi:hypothetical protein